MTEPTPTTPFAVFGLYRDRATPQIILAIDKADARRQYHDRYPGWDGTTLMVKSLEEMTETRDD